MSAPLAARFAARTARTVQRRNVSMSSVRRWAQGFETHPFERIPVASNPQKGDYTKMFKRAGTSLVVFAPSIGILLGWPLIGAVALNGHIR